MKRRHPCLKNSIVALRPQAIPANGAWHRPCLYLNDYAKNIPVPNEHMDFEKSCVEHQCGPRSALTYLKAKAPCSGITLERKALRVIYFSLAKHLSRCFAPGRAAKIQLELTSEHFSKILTMSQTSAKK